MLRLPLIARTIRHIMALHMTAVQMKPAPTTPVATSTTADDHWDTAAHHPVMRPPTTTWT
jgi:hypothetical protein